MANRSTSPLRIALGEPLSVGYPKHMVTRVHELSVRVGSLLSAAALAFACGGGGSGSHDDAEIGGSRSSGGGDAAGGESGAGQPYPTRLPDSAADCRRATGSDGCYFVACCDELIACRKNADCANAFDCYAKCQGDSDCFASCAAAALASGGEDLSAALACVLPRSITCSGSSQSGGSAGGEGGSAGADGGTLGTATDGLGWNLQVSANLITAELEPDEGRAVSKEITVDGGALSAVATDGTTFTLTIPEGALFGPTVITLTPLSSFSVVEVPGESHGVRIEPDGLPLLASPTLEVEPPKGESWPASAIVPLAITGRDQHVSLALVDPAAKPLSFALTHFSSYVSVLSDKGVDATVSDRDVRSRFGGDAEERLQSASAERLAQQRAGKTVNELGLDELFKEYEKLVLKPRVDGAGKSCAVGKLAVRTMLGISRQKQLLGLDDDPFEAFGPLMDVVGPVCVQEEYALCRDEHIITRILPVFFAFAREAQVLGLGTEIAGTNIPPDWVIQAEEAVKKCLKFELHLDSNVLYSSIGNKMSMNETVTAVVPIDLKATVAELPADLLPPGAAPLGALITGDGAPLDSTAYAVHTDERCRTIDSEERKSGEAFVSFLTFTPSGNAPDTIGGSTEIADVGLSLAIAQNTSHYTYTQQAVQSGGCREVIASGDEVLSWSTTLGAYLLQSKVNDKNGAFISDWKPVNTDIIATNDLELSTSDGDSSARGQVHFVLFHTPE